jgi:hypothetical protein
MENALKDKAEVKKVSEIELAVSGLEETLATKADKTDLNNYASKTELDSYALKTDLDSKVNIGDFNSAKSALETDISNHDGRIGGLESSVGQLGQ